MKFTKVVDSNKMKLTGKRVQMGKFDGLGYELTIGKNRVDLCGVAVGELGVTLNEGESIDVLSIAITFSK